MANILKTNKTFTDPRDLVNGLTTAYGVVEQVVVNNSTKEATVYYSIYSRECTDEERANGTVKPISESTLIVKDYVDLEGVERNHFTTYFCCAVLSESGKNIFERAYWYLGEIQPEIPNVLWVDWESDEVGGVPQTLPHKK